MGIIILRNSAAVLFYASTMRFTLTHLSETFTTLDIFLNLPFSLRSRDSHTYSSVIDSCDDLHFDHSTGLHHYKQGYTFSVSKSNLRIISESTIHYIFFLKIMA